jgi:LPXTG-site transpeptidase (sortase) family protein
MTIGVLFVLLSSEFLAYAQYADRQLSNVVPVRPMAGLTNPAASDLASVVLSSEEVTSAERSAPPTRISIASINLDSRVIELGTREENGQLVWETAAHAVGWYRTSAVPGQGGNIVMSGHISSPLKGEGSIFRRLPEVKLGDIVTVETAAGEYSFQVFAREIVLPSAVVVMAPTPTETLTLITCYPDLIYSHRLIVQARPLDEI